MTTGTVIWFLVTSFWTFDGQFKVMGGGQFTEPECVKMKRAEEQAKKDMPGLFVTCLRGMPKPKGLPEVQPHVPGKIEA